jgi:hypothetical protein
MTTDKIIELLLQVPLAGVNIIVVVLFLRFLERNDERQKEFIADQRKDNNHAVCSLAHELAKLDGDIGALKEVTIEHNALMLAAITEMRQAIARRSKGGS